MSVFVDVLMFHRQLDVTRFPFAVGRLLVNLDLPPSRGKAVEVLHWFGDLLWSMGPMTSPHPCFTAKYVSGRVQAGEEAFEPADASSYDCSYTAAEAAAVGDAGGGGKRAEQTDDGWGYEEEGSDEGRKEEEEDPADNNSTWEDSEEGDSGKREEETEDHDKEEEGGESRGAEVPAEQTGAKDTANTPAGEDRGVSSKLELTPEQLDEVLEICLLEALHVTVTDEQLPLDASALYSKMVAASEYIVGASALLRKKLEGKGMTVEQLRGACSADVSLDVKKSTHKKLAKFLQTYTKKKLFQTKDTRGVVFIVNVNREHPTYKAYIPVPVKDRKLAPAHDAAAAAADGTAPKASDTTTTTTTTTTSGGTTGELVILEFFQPSQKCLPIFAAVGVKTGKDNAFTITQCNEVLSNYVQSVLPGNLPQGVEMQARDDSVPLDFHLRAALVTKEEKSIPTMTKKELFERFQKAMNVCHKVYRACDGPARAPLRKGAVPPVKITIEDRSGGCRHTTHIVGLNTFHVEQTAVAAALQKQLACSASTYPLPGKAKELAIMVQGRSGTQSAQFLETQCFIPKKYIQIQSKEKKPKPK
eukprot:GHVS01076454.1.p1 GENE.GHVS01076454.1~~GHVS01076454.1.p1  ORF type:complete len:587 (-),score=115.76 GHVS01076454.1:129-1889(-)